MNIAKDRLLKLAQHLKTGKLIKPVFNFNDFENCAVTQLVAIFPNDWEFRLAPNEPDKLYPLLKDKNYLFPYTSCRAYFGLTVSQYDHLFTPTLQKPEQYGGVMLDEHATKEQVAENILAYCKLLK